MLTKWSPIQIPIWVLDVVDGTKVLYRNGSVIPMLIIQTPAVPVGNLSVSMNNTQMLENSINILTSLKLKHPT